MVGEELDEIDNGILNLLQQDARNFLPAEMAERLPVSEGTVRNRLRKLEERGVIEGYYPRLNYEAAGYPLRIVFSCRAPIPERGELARQALDVTGVISVREMMTGTNNIRVLAAAENSEGVTAIATKLSELGLTVEVEDLMRREYTRPFNHFGAEVVEGGDGDPKEDETRDSDE